MKYLSYYGLEKDPFQKEIKTEELYESLEFKQGLSRLEYLKEIKGIGLITGVVGIGKTALLRKFKDNLNPENKLSPIHKVSLEFEHPNKKIIKIMQNIYILFFI